MAFRKYISLIDSLVKVETKTGKYYTNSVQTALEEGEALKSITFRRRPSVDDKDEVIRLVKLAEGWGLDVEEAPDQEEIKEGEKVVPPKRKTSNKRTR